MKEERKKQLVIVSIAAGILCVLGTIAGFFIKRRQKKIVKENGKVRMLYPQDIVLEKSLLRLIPEYILPSYFSILRIILTPFAAYYIVRGSSLYFAVFVYLLVAFTDTIDGALARTRDQITNFGKVIDPIADKLLFIVVGLLLLPKFNAQNLLIIILSMEFFSVGVGYLFFRDKSDFAANIFGKIKLLFQVTGMVFFLIANYYHNSDLAKTGIIFLTVSIILHLFSMVVFVVQASKNAKQEKI